MTTDVHVPDIGDFTDVPVVSVLVSVGDTVAAEDPLIELESDEKLVGVARADREEESREDDDMLPEMDMLPGMDDEVEGSEDR